MLPKNSYLLLMDNKNEILRKTISNWYETNRRALPWRATADPYKIWISEIILQQTRVNQGLNYYLRFVENFPNVHLLADATEDEVLKYWQGLGYYSRGRNLHKAAKQIVNEFDGIFPKDYNDILSLPGVGHYTASAICSFAYNQSYAVLDGNVFRVLARLFAVSLPIDTHAGQKYFARLSQELLDVSDSSTHNQAMMEFGALQCTPQNPKCEMCRLQTICDAYKLNIVSILPVKQGKTTVSDRYFNYFFIENGKFTYLQKRTKKDIWQNLYEMPLIETDGDLELQELMQTEDFSRLFSDIRHVDISEVTFEIKHVLSHRRIFTKFYSVKISEENQPVQALEKLKLSEIEKYAVSRLTEIFFEKRQA